MVRVAREGEAFHRSDQGVFVLIGARHVFELGNSVDLVGSPTSRSILSVSKTPKFESIA
jgi:hypothetical protein